MKEKLVAFWGAVKEHKAQIIRIAAIVIGAGVGVAVGAMFNEAEEEYLPSEDLDDVLLDESEIELNDEEPSEENDEE